MTCRRKRRNRAVRSLGFVNPKSTGSKPRNSLAVPPSSDFPSSSGTPKAKKPKINSPPGRKGPKICFRHHGVGPDPFNPGGNLNEQYTPVHLPASREFLEVFADKCEKGQMSDIARRLRKMLLQAAIKLPKCSAPVSSHGCIICKAWRREKKGLLWV